MICKTTLDKIGKAAYNALSEEDKQKYTTASGIISIITGAIKTGNYVGAVTDIGLEAIKVGVSMGTTCVISLAVNYTGYHSDEATLSGAVTAIADYIKSQYEILVDQAKHDLAAKLAIMFGIDENPGVLGAIMEWIYKSIVQPALQLV